MSLHVWCFELGASTQESTRLCLRIKKRSGCVASCHNRQIFQGPWSLQATWLCVQVTFLHISRSLAKGGCQQWPHRGWSCAFTPSGSAQESKGSKIKTLQIPTTAAGVVESDAKGKGAKTREANERQSQKKPNCCLILNKGCHFVFVSCSYRTSRLQKQ